MKVIVCLIVIVCSTAIGFAQVSDEERMESIKALHQILDTSQLQYVLSDVPLYRVEGMRQAVAKTDTIFGLFPYEQVVPYIRLSNSDKYQIDSCLRALRYFIWTRKKLRSYQIPHVKVMDREYSIGFQSNPESIVFFSKPIFLQGADFCMVYQETGIGEAASGMLKVFVKVQSRWKFWSWLYSWFT